MACEIRRAIQDDTETLLRLWRALMDEHQDMDTRFTLSDDAEERWRNDLDAWLTDDVHRYFVAVDDGGVVGFLHAQRWMPAPIYGHAIEIYLNEIYVEVPARRHGIGRRLVETAHRWANEQQAVRLRLGALAVNTTATRFWEAVGARALLTEFTFELRAAGDDEPPQHRPIGFIPGT